MPDPVLSRFLDEAKDLLPSAVLLRRRIHENPELGLDLPLTTQAVLEGCRASMSISRVGHQHPVSSCH